MRQPIPSRALKLFACCIAVLAVWTAWCAIGAGNTGEYKVLGSCWGSGLAANHHGNPFGLQPQTWVFPFRNERIVDLNFNPPLLLPVFQLLALLPLHAAATVWALVSFFGFAGTAFYLLRERPGMPEPAIICLCLAGPILDSIDVGQTYFLLYALGAVAWIALERAKPTRAAIALGALIAIKPPLAICLPFLMVRQKLRLGLLAGCSALGLSLLPLPFYGPHIYADWIASLRLDRHFIIPSDVSAPAIFARFGHPTLGIAAGVFVFAALLAATRVLNPASPTRLGIGMCAAILCSPLAWLHYLLILFPAFTTADKGRARYLSLLLLSEPFFVPATLLLQPGVPRFLAYAFCFAPCCLLLTWLLRRA